MRTHACRRRGVRVPPAAALRSLTYCASHLLSADFSLLSGQRKQKVDYLKQIAPLVMPLVKHGQTYLEQERAAKEGDKKKKKMAFPLLACVR